MVRLVRDDTGWVVVVEWLPAELLRPGGLRGLSGSADDPGNLYAMFPAPGVYDAATTLLVIRVWDFRTPL